MLFHFWTHIISIAKMAYNYLQLVMKRQMIKRQMIKLFWILTFFLLFFIRHPALSPKECLGLVVYVVHEVRVITLQVHVTHLPFKVIIIMLFNDSDNYVVTQINEVHNHAWSQSDHPSSPCHTPAIRNIIIMLFNDSDNHVVTAILYYKTHVWLKWYSIITPSSN